MSVKITSENVGRLKTGDIIIKHPLQGSVKNELELYDDNNYISYKIDNVDANHKNKFKLSLENKHFQPKFNSNIYPMMYQVNGDELINGYWWLKE